MRADGQMTSVRYPCRERCSANRNVYVLVPRSENVSASSRTSGLDEAEDMHHRIRRVPPNVGRFRIRFSTKACLRPAGSFIIWVTPAAVALG